MKYSWVILQVLWYWLNSQFGIRSYFVEDGIGYVKEGCNKPEVLKDHLKRYHPEEYKEVYGE